MFHGAACRYAEALDIMGPETAVAETVNALREMYGADVVPEVSGVSGAAADMRCL